MMPLRCPPRRGFTANSPDMDVIAMRTLFANNAQGGWWPADPRYAYEDSAGTTAASVDGVVGLRYDASKGLDLGADIIVGGDMEVAIPANTYNRITLERSTDRAKTGLYSAKGICDNQSGFHYLSFTGLTVGKTYRLSLSVYIPTNDIYSAFISQAGSVNQGITITGRDLWIDIDTLIYANYPNVGVTAVSSSSNSPVFYIDNVSIKEVLGNHAIQSTTANKPYLLRTPNSNNPWYDSNTATGALTATFSGSLGSACTIATLTPEGVTFADNQTVGTTYNICPPYGYNSDVLIINRALTAAEKALVTRVFSRNLPVLGSNIAANSAFAADTDWAKGAGWSISAGVATKTAGTASNLTQTIGVSGNQYLVTADITRTAGTVGAYNGTAQMGATAATTTGAKYTMKTTSTTIGFMGDSSFAGTVDNAVIQEIL